MADIDDINSDGLFFKTRDVLVNELTAQFRAIFEADGYEVNLSPQTPDGQLLNIFVQAGIDLRELIAGIYNEFDPDNTVGINQDRLYALNYIIRKSGSYTHQNIDITVETGKTVFLQGLDTNYENPDFSGYTISDDNGGLWYLINSTTISAGVNTPEFRAQNKGAVRPFLNTIKNQVTVKTEITTVNNSTAPITIGTEYETDEQFRIRRNKSMYIRSTGNKDAAEAQIKALNDVLDCAIYENRTEQTVDGIPPHGRRVIVDGGPDNDIAQVIYNNIGSNDTIGAVEETIYSLSGQPNVMRFDRPEPVALFISFEMYSNQPESYYNLDAIKNSIVSGIQYTIGAAAETSAITGIISNVIQSMGGQAVALNVQISVDDTAWTSYIDAPDKDSKFTVSDENITVNFTEAS